MFYVDINAEVENQQAAKEVGKNIYSYNGKSCGDVKDISTPLRMPKMSTSKVSPKTSPSIKHRLIKNESINDDDEDDDVNESLFPRCKSIKKKTPARVPPIESVIKQQKQKSETIKSTNSGVEDFNTPPESPSLNSSASFSLNSKSETSRSIDGVFDKPKKDEDEKNTPPVPPPRTRRGLATKSAKNKLKELHIAAESLEIVANELVNIGETLDMSSSSATTLPHNGTPEKIVPSVIKVENDLKGYMHMLVISAKGLRQTMKTRWFVYDKKAGKLKYYRDEAHELQGELPIGQLDLSTATFCYDVETDTSGEFTIVTRMGEHTLSAGTSDKRMYWLSQLQRARREFSQAGAAAAARSSMSCQVGLLKSPVDESPTNPVGGNITTGNALSQASAIAAGNIKDSSPFKDIMQTLEKPPLTPTNEGGGSLQGSTFAIGGGVTEKFKNAGVYSSPPKSADYYSGNKNKGSSFSFIKNNWRLPRSNSTVTSSMSQPQDLSGNNPVSPPPPVSRPLAPSSTPGSFQALSKIRKSLREKRSASSGSFGGIGSPKRPNLEQVKSVGSFASSSAMFEDSTPDMVAAFRDEAQASKEVISVLRTEVEKLELEKETLTKLQRPEINEGQLLEILRQKDSQIVGLESMDREKQRELDMKQSELDKLQVEMKVYKDLIERKDASIVDLTNQLHEIELNQVQANAVVTAAVLGTSTPPINDSATSAGETKSETIDAQNSDTSIKYDPQATSLTTADEEEKSIGPLSLKTIVSACTAAKRFQTANNSIGMSFDSERKIFREFVEVGTQTKSGHQSGQEITPFRGKVIEEENPPPNKSNAPASLGEWEKLQDTVLAYEMQNKFLNKEVLELNQLRTQANDREQKLFIEASDWEAKFYQIQSKYLLLLNELHNPQVGVSASRQEMVSQLLKDVIEAAETRSGPLASTKSDSENSISKSKNVSYDRFGFRIDIGMSTDSMEEKVEKLRKQAESQLQNQTAEKEEIAQLENREGKWNEAIATLNSKAQFTMTSDIKSLLRLGIPISQRGAVWKAIVEKRVMRCGSEKFQKDYYKKLLANYNPSQKYTSAAKQIELDLLRTLPNNKHYDGPHADGIAKLRRILLAYSVHNPEVEYCQGFNRIAAITLLFMHEEDAFWCLVFIIEHLMPVDYYSRDKQLIGAQVDQEVLKELINEKLPKLSAHFSAHGVDPTLFTLNWFLCLFVDDPIPVKTYLHIWDAFLFEGSKVLFRYAIAIFKYMENILLQQTDYMTIYRTLRDGLETLVDTRKLTQIAFHDLNPFPMRSITNKRDHHYKLLEAKKRELDHIRQNYRKNSLARTSSSVAMKPIMAMAGITAGDFVDETMEDELNTKENDEKEEKLKATEDAKSGNKEEIVSGNSGCSDEKK